jgi:hypothetical protein
MNDESETRPSGTAVDGRTELWLSRNVSTTSVIDVEQPILHRSGFILAKHPRALSLPKRSSRLRWAKIVAVVVLVGATGLCCVFRRPWFLGNLGVVDPGRVMRSAQPTGQLGSWLREYGIESILNLRGGSPANWWYDAEVRSAAENAVAYYDWPLSATRRPSRRELLVLIDFLKRCEYPLLIHCKSGADRTGLVAALYLMVCRGESPERALGAFSIEYGHIPLFGTEHLHEPLNEYAAWLKTNRQPHTPVRFQAWVKNDYRAEVLAADPPALRPGPRARRPQAAPTRQAAATPQYSR